MTEIRNFILLGFSGFNSFLTSPSSPSQFGVGSNDVFGSSKYFLWQDSLSGLRYNNSKNALFTKLYMVSEEGEYHTAFGVK